nr:MAG: hypothetical protein [Apis mellifera filamentous virus]
MRGNTTIVGPTYGYASSSTDDFMSRCRVFSPSASQTKRKTRNEPRKRKKSMHHLDDQVTSQSNHLLTNRTNNPFHNP